MGKGIIARVNMPKLIVPVRAYIHGDGIEAYGKSLPEQIVTSRDHVKEIIESEPNLRQFSYIIAMAWGTRKDRVLDCFGCSDTKKWDENFYAVPMQFRNGKFEESRFIGEVKFCTDGFRTFGLEDVYRLTTENLEEFLHNPPPKTRLGLPNLLEPDF